MKTQFNEKANKPVKELTIETDLVLPDMHDCYGDKDKLRFILAGLHILDLKPRKVISIGDFLTMDSLNAHDTKGTLGDKNKPSLRQDLNSGSKALDLLQAPVKAYNKKQREGKRAQYKPEWHITLGNHDGDQGGFGKGRWDRFVANNPELEGMTPITDLFESKGFKVTPYGEYLTVGDVAYTHAPFSAANKPLSGLNLERKAALANNARVLIFGHKHTPGFHVETVNNPFEENYGKVAICVGSCVEPESWTKPGPSAWGMNLVEVTYVNGKYSGHKFVSMIELIARHKDHLNLHEKQVPNHLKRYL